LELRQITLLHRRRKEKEYKNNHKIYNLFNATKKPRKKKKEDIPEKKIHFSSFY